MLKAKHKSFILSLAIIMLMNQVILENSFGMFRYLDEIIAMIAFFYLVTTKQNKKNCIFYICCLLFTILIIGLIGNTIYGVQVNGIPIFTDIVNIFKGYIVFLSAYSYFENNNKEDLRYYTLKYLNAFCKIIVLPGFLLAIVNLFINIGMHTEYAYGFRAFHYIYYRVGNLNVICSEIIMIMTFYLQYAQGRQRKLQLCFIVMTLILMLSTLRTRAFLNIAIYIAAYLYFVKGKHVKIKLRYILIISMLGIWISIPKIRFYFLNSPTTARSVLLRYGIQTAKTYFPFGAGFGSYGTYAAKAYRSQLYDEYLFNDIYGLSEKFDAFLTDDYWPAIMGEFGFIGAVIILIVIILIFKILLNKTESNRYSRCAAIFGLVQITVASFVSASFFHTTAVPLLLINAIVTNNLNDQENKQWNIWKEGKDR